MATKVLVNVDLEPVACCNCAVVFGMPDQMLSARRRDGKTFYCPNGHGQSFSETDADKLRRQLAVANAQLVHARDQADAEERRRKTAERSAAALRGHNAKLREQIAAGKCPACSRSFTDLREHMATKHPDYAGAEPAEELADADA